ncbi:MAG: histidine phosphatase family protein [Raoultibacter sp.]
MQFFVVRHGQTLFNVMQKVQGWCDTPLTAQGVAGAESLGRGLADTAFTAAYSSDSGRAIATLDSILQPQSAPPLPVRDARLREWCYGELEGEYGTKLRDVLTQGFGAELPMEVLNTRMPEVASVLADADTSGRAERFDVIESRIASFFEEAGKAALSTGGGNVLVVTHAFVIKSLVYLWARDRVNEVVKIENTSVTKVVFDGECFDVRTIGDTSYLR